MVVTVFFTLMRITSWPQRLHLTDGPVTVWVLVTTFLFGLVWAWLSGAPQASRVGIARIQAAARVATVFLGTVVLFYRAKRSTWRCLRGTPARLSSDWSTLIIAFGPQRYTSRSFMSGTSSVRCFGDSSSRPSGVW